MNPAAKTLKEITFGAYRFQRNRLMSEEEMNLFFGVPPAQKTALHGALLSQGIYRHFAGKPLLLDFCCYRSGRLGSLLMER